MQLGHRVEDGRRVRVVQWDDDSFTDLSTILVLLVDTVICSVAIVGATQTTGWPRVLLTALAIISGLLWIALAGTFLIIGVVVVAVRARRITPALDALLAVMSASIGAVAGVQTYESGPGALVVGPAIAVLAVSAAWSRLSSRRSRQRFVALALLGAVVAVVVGSTVFL